MDVTQLLAFGVEQGASDCHLSAGEPPMLRVNGDLKSWSIRRWRKRRFITWSMT